ncbi:MAG TPA: acetyl-CoA carboxylase carboxyltransferase subunit alpha [Ktedonobacteraceae bacterium]|nr:acetyl-CoA carboxylase carboxyltransferase subunit alpha [Ktedonobacteraceae bacterium]
MAYDLEFEKPLAELEKKIATLQKKGDRLKPEEHRQIQDLERELRRRTEEIYRDLTSWQTVQIARHKDRPHSLDYLHMICDDFFELCGDRAYSDDHAILGGLSQIDGETLMFVCHQKGRTMKDKQYYNNGMPHPEGFRKAGRLMLQAEKFGLPVVTLIDTQGAFPALEDEERGQAEAIASNLYLMSRLRVPTLGIVIGEGGSGGALALGVTDRILIMEFAIYTVTSPESAASIIWRSTSFAQQAADAMRIGGRELKTLGLVDDIIPEPLGGAHHNPRLAAETLKATIQKNLAELKQIPLDELLEMRYQKYRSIGHFAWADEAPQT